MCWRFISPQILSPLKLPLRWRRGGQRFKLGTGPEECTHHAREDPWPGFDHTAVAKNLGLCRDLTVIWYTDTWCFNGIQWWFNGDSMGFNGIGDGMPSGNLLQFAIENGPVKIVDLPSYFPLSWGISKLAGWWLFHGNPIFMDDD